MSGQRTAVSVRRLTFNSRRLIALSPYLLVFLLLLAGCARGAPAVSAPALTGRLVVRAPTEIHVSAPVPVEVARADAPEGMDVTLVAQGSYGARVYHAAFRAGRAALVIPGEDTRQSGIVTLIATAGAARGEASLAIRPGTPADPITPQVGPRSVVADGKHWSMVAAIPFDDYGNPVEDGTPVEVRVLHPDGALDRQIIAVTHLVAWQRLPSSTRAGRTTVSVTTQGAHGPDATFVEAPGWPVPFDLSASPADAPADGRQLVTLRTDIIRDAFGNPMLDGTLVTFVIDIPGSQPRFIPAYTIDGAAEGQLQAPDAPGEVAVRATLYGVESRPLTIAFAPGPAVGSFPVVAQVNARDGVVTVAAGPLLGPLDQFVPDGTLVRFRIVGPDGAARQVDGLAEQGRARIELRQAQLDAGAYTVEATAGSGRGTTTFVAP